MFVTVAWIVRMSAAVSVVGSVSFAAVLLVVVGEAHKPCDKDGAAYAISNLVDCKCVAGKAMMTWALNMFVLCVVCVFVVILSFVGVVLGAIGAVMFVLLVLVVFVLLVWMWIAAIMTHAACCVNGAAEHINAWLFGCHECSPVAAIGGSVVDLDLCTDRNYAGSNSIVHVMETVVVIGWYGADLVSACVTTYVELVP